MTGLAEHRAARWALAALDALEPRGFAQIDIDQLISLSTVELARDAAINAFTAVRDVLHAKGVDFTAAVVFPLQPVSEMMTTPFSLEDWSSSVELQFNVPGLYIASPEAFIGLESTEEYRTSIALIDPRLSDAVSYFRVFRSASEAERGWEYSRAIYVLDAPVAALKEVRVAFST